MRLPISPKALTAAAFLAAFLICAIPAYQGYFLGDDLENLSWTSVSPIGVFASGLVDPRLSPNNFRPAGHFFFWALSRLAGDHFGSYLLMFQLLHAVNAALVFHLSLRLSGNWPAAAAGAALFTFHAAQSAAFTMPMYIFDVLCGTFALLSLLSFGSGRWLLSLGCLWLAYKSKEVAIGLPMALLLWQVWLPGEAARRSWLRLLPFFAISCAFGGQALLADRPADAYSLRFTWEAFSTCARFYGRAMGWVLLAALVVAPLAARSRAAMWGLLSGAAMLAPLLFLPGRLFAIYLYVPMALLAAGAAAALARLDGIPCARLAGAVVIASFLRVNPANGELLRQAAERRAFVDQLRGYVEAHPDATRLVCEDAPPSLESWGVEGSAKWVSRWRVEARTGPREEGWRTLVWNSTAYRLEAASAAHGIIEK
jgi:hypothetical protein